ncbi:MAG TPA: hypothetical protein VEY67_10365 [Candidatus Dormibacteraeota bacterium]|nr:hypothetical protein [Candidatus Dormibacteraeota bacterium]
MRQPAPPRSTGIARRWLRRSDGGELLEWFLVAGVVSVIGIRSFLAAAGYPRVGNGTLHIAHMLWGGAFMVVALVILFLYLDRSAHRVAAVVGGLGFGTFIDEIGKFVTADNDYFFRPALVLIYVVFVALFLVYRTVAGGHLTQDEDLANALDVVQPAVAHPLDTRSRGVVARLLDASDPTDPMVPALRSWVRGRWDGGGDDPLDRVAARAEAVYDAAIANPLFERALVVIVLIDAAAAVVGSVALVLATRDAATESATVSHVGETLSAVLGALLVVRGISVLPFSRLEAYRWFRRGVLVWILVTQLFVFYTSQLAGLAGLAVTVLSYAALSYMIGREIAAAHRASGDETVADGSDEGSTAAPGPAASSTDRAVPR